MALLLCAPLLAIRVEPQLGPWRPYKALFHPSDPFELLIVEGDGVVSVWNVEDKERPERRLTIYTNATDAVYTRDGQIVTGGRDGYLRRWDREGQELWLSQKRHKGRIRAVAFHQNKQLGVLASAGEDGKVRLWNSDGFARGDPLTGHSGEIHSVAFSPDGESLASTGEDATVRLWNLDGTARGAPLTAHGGRVFSVAYSPDGMSLATAGAAGELRLWNQDGSVRKEPLAGHQGGVNSVAYSPDGQLLVSAGADGTVRLWKPDGLPRGKPLEGHDGWVHSVTFSSDGQFLASVGQHGTLRLWNLDGSPQGEALNGHEGGVYSVAYSPDGQSLASGGEDGTVRLWHLDGSPRGESLTGHVGAVFTVTFSPDGQILASAGEDGTVRLWNLDGSLYGEPLAGDIGEVWSVAFSPDGRLLATAGEDGVVRLWNLDGSPHEEPFVGHENVVESVVFSPNGKFLASAGFDGTVRLWNLDGSVRREPFTGHDGWVRSVAFSPDGQILASAGDDGTVRLWNLDGSAHGEPLTGHEGRVRSVAFAPEGRTLTSAGSDGTVRLWNVNGSARGEPFTGHAGEVWFVAHSPDGQSLASAGGDGTVRFWTLGGSPRGKPLKGRLNLVDSVAFSFEAQSLASAGPDDTIRVWELDGSARREPHIHHDSRILSIAFSPDGRNLASAGVDGTVRLWNLEGSVREAPFTGHRGRVWSVAFSPDGQSLASAGDDGAVRLWGLDGSARGKIPIRHEGRIWSVAFAPDGQSIASAGDDGTVRLWGLDGSARGEILTGHEGRVRSVAFSPDGQYLASVGDEGTIYLWELLNPHKPIRSLVAATGEIGYFRGALFTLSPAGRVTIFSETLEPRARIILTPEGGLAWTTMGWFGGSSELWVRIRHFLEVDESALDADEAFAHYHRPAKVIATIQGHTFWESLRAKLVGAAQTVKVWHESLEWWQKLGFWPTLFYVLLVLTCALIWLFRPSSLAHRAMLSSTEPKLPPWKWALQTASLIQWLGGTQRALDTWLRRHEDDLYPRLFADRESVQDRERYVDLGHTEGVDAWYEDASAGRPATAWISGPGGAGKSTLAFRMARTQRRKANTRHPVLPVVVEEDWQDSLLTHLSKRLHVDDRRPSDQMVQKLAHTGRLLVIVDGLSERRNAGAEDEVLDLTRQGTLRHLLVTTRSPDPPEQEFQHLEVGPLGPERLPEFVRAYVDDADPEPIEEALRRFARGEPLRPLFARLAVEQYRDTGELPATVPELVVRYVQTLHRPESGTLIESDFRRAARVAAKACVLDELAPRAIDEAELRGHLKGQDVPFRNADGQELPGSKVLDELASAGLLERSVVLGYDRVRFANEPVAEYLVALAVAGEGEEAVRDLQEKIAEKGEGARGLGEALEQVLGA